MNSVNCSVNVTLAEEGQDVGRYGRGACPLIDSILVSKCGVILGHVKVLGKASF